MDMVITTPYIPKEGETLNGENFFLNGGGKGANQAVAAAKQNTKVYMIGSVGNDIFGNELIQNLNNYNVDISHLYKLPNTSTGVAMIIICNNDNRIILDGGANHKISYIQIDEALNNATENDIFISQLENNLEAVVYGLKKAKEHNMITIFNPAPAVKLHKDVFDFVDYLFCLS
jgi:ribokinase